MIERAVDYGAAGLGVAVVVVIVRAFIGYLEKRDRAQAAALVANERRVEAFLGNHLSHITRTLEGLTLTIDGMRRDLKAGAVTQPKRAKERKAR